MIAFADAVSLGYRYLETDVHATADGKVIAFHDDDLSRTCGVDMRITDLSWSDLSQVRVHGSEPIPRLEELLTSYPEARINIDCKTDAALAPLIRLLRQLKCLDRVCIGSFSDDRLRVIRQEFQDEVCTSMGPKQIARLLTATKTFTSLAKPLRGLVAQVPMKQSGIRIISTKFIQTAHRFDIPVHVWTIDEVKDMNELLNIGVDGIMTDNTRALKDVFISRDLW
jgi:glycerophosphoryl diester phosphodiesterase